MRLGQTSVGYRVAVFRADEEEASALGRFVHVYIDRAARRPVDIPSDIRTVLETVHATTAELFARAGLDQDWTAKSRQRRDRRAHSSPSGDFESLVTGASELG